MKRTGPVLIVILCLIFPPLPPLHTANASFQPPIQLTFNTAFDRGPVISSDGLKVAFYSDVDGDNEIYMIDSDGTGLRPLTTNSFDDTAPSISSNGSTVAFQRISGNDADIYVVNSDGSELRLSPQNSVDDTDPAMSGDGLWVAFVSNDNPLGLNPEGDPEIFLVGTNGANLRQLTQNTGDDLLPTISSDGGKIAFQSMIAGTFEIFVINSDRTGLTRLTTNNEHDTSPSISLDGQKVAYESRAPATESTLSLMGAGEQPLIPPEIYVVNSNGVGVPVQVSATGGDSLLPSISGDGSIVAYVGTGDGDAEVYTVKSDGAGQPTNVTANAVLDQDPSLDFDGDTVAYRSNLGGDFEIFVAHSAVIHDVAVTQVAVPRRIGYNSIPSNPLQVNVTVENQGDFSETVTVEVLFLGGPVLSSQTSQVSAGSSKVLSFGLSPQPLARGTYTLVARAVALPGETDTADNSLQDGPIEVRSPGDVDGDGDVDIDDLILTYLNQFTTVLPSPYDIDNDGDVDIDDLIITFTHQFT